ncbi:helix-turn-helix domain-containing GNAT family N-acetyltransferase [Nioella sp. MMSF_3534]|uniref:bifunctional helix-turn-helix transcriptional regulator/GNAT family N-acetyltransferase n=1 Tax=Nioella sp. MMSF_3534 TaxID=3046720 RepID=UPI00273E0975|nr:helix-turn-helix domain-containing GNAT family N-acetyltransferase [Nioella sp. MMSF_3534]
MTDDIQRIRRFNRAVTSEVGALDTSFLGLGRPLGSARVLNAIGHGLQEVGVIRDYLGLDSGLMSRLLRGLEAEGMITTGPSPDDSRRRIAQLTDEGRAAFTEYERLSNDQARAILARHPRPQAILDAMDLIATALGQDRIEIIEIDPREPEAIHCLTQYYRELERRFATGFDVNLSRDPEATDMIRPRGVFLLAMSDALPIGCVGLKGGDGPVAEIKRLWVSPAARGLKLATRLMTRAEDVARSLGIHTLRLDTNSALPEAAALYRKTGWQEIDRFNDDPYPDMFFEKTL